MKYIWGLVLIFTLSSAQAVRIDKGQFAGLDAIGDDDTDFEMSGEKTAVRASTSLDDLVKAIRTDNGAGARALLEHDRSLAQARNNVGVPVIFTAADAANIKMLDLLEAFGADLTVKDRGALSLVHRAAMGSTPGHIAFVRHLIEKKGFDPNETVVEGDKQGFTPLGCAAWLNHNIPMSRELIRLGARPNILDSDGANLIHHLVFDVSASDFMRELVEEHGVAIDIPNSRGYTPLNKLMRDGGPLESAQFLVGHGADVTTRAYTGQSLLQSAIEHARSVFEPVVDEFGDEGVTKSIPADPSEYNQVQRHAIALIEFVIKCDPFMYSGELLRTGLDSAGSGDVRVLIERHVKSFIERYRREKRRSSFNGSGDVRVSSPRPERFRGRKVSAAHRRARSTSE
jgi:ankyrin repeat protein